MAKDTRRIKKGPVTKRRNRRKPAVGVKWEENEKDRRIPKNRKE